MHSNDGDNNNYNEAKMLRAKLAAVPKEKVMPPVGTLEKYLHEIKINLGSAWHPSTRKKWRKENNNSRNISRESANIADGGPPAVAVEVPYTTILPIIIPLCDN